MVVALAATAIVAVIVGVTVGVSNGAPAENYCLYIGTNNQTGTPGTLAVPQSGATQSSCDALETSVQLLFTSQQTTAESFAISSVRPTTLSSGQAAALKPFTSQPGWLYSGDV